MYVSAYVRISSDEKNSALENDESKWEDDAAERDNLLSGYEHMDNANRVPTVPRSQSYGR